MNTLALYMGGLGITPEDQARWDQAKLVSNEANEIYAALAAAGAERTHTQQFSLAGQIRTGIAEIARGAVPFTQKLLDLSHKKLAELQSIQRGITGVGPAPRPGIPKWVWISGAAALAAFAFGFIGKRR